MPGSSGGFKVQAAASELALPSMSWDWVPPGRHRCPVAAPPRKLWVLGLPLNCCRHSPGHRGPRNAAQLTHANHPSSSRGGDRSLAHDCVRSGAGCGLTTSPISHFSFFLSGKSCRRLPGLGVPQHPCGGRSGRLPYVSEGGTLQNSLHSEADLIKSQFYGACANYNF